MSNMYFSTGTAIFLTLFAASLWGSWMQIIKHRGNYPLYGIPFMLYMYSFVFIWVITFILAPFLLPDGIVATTQANMDVIPRILFGGAIMACGMQVSLQVMGAVGLLLSTAVSGATGSILGIITSVAAEGLPDAPHALLLLIACTTVFILASFVCNYAAVLRDRDRAATAGKTLTKVESRGPVTFKIILMLIVSTLLVNGWSIGTAAGTAAGVPPILTCAYMATGSFIGMILTCGIYFTVKRKWKIVLCIGQPKKPLFLSLIGAVCHYGGNLISIYAMPVISATLSFLFGRTANVWTYFWGFFYKEFAGSKKRTYVVLACGIGMYFLGIALLFFFNYS